MAVVELVGGAIRIPALGHDENIVAATEGIGENGTWSKVHIRVVARRLASGRTVKVPFGEIVDTSGLLAESLRI